MLVLVFNVILLINAIIFNDNNVGGTTVVYLFFYYEHNIVINLPCINSQLFLLFKYHMLIIINYYFPITIVTSDLIFYFVMFHMLKTQCVLYFHLSILKDNDRISQSSSSDIITYFLIMLKLCMSKKISTIRVLKYPMLSHFI